MLFLSGIACAERELTSRPLSPPAREEWTAGKGPSLMKSCLPLLIVSALVVTTGANCSCEEPPGTLELLLTTPVRNGVNVPVHQPAELIFSAALHNYAPAEL